MSSAVSLPGSISLLLKSAVLPSSASFLAISAISFLKSSIVYSFDCSLTIKLFKESCKLRHQRDVLGIDMIMLCQIIRGPIGNKQRPEYPFKKIHAFNARFVGSESLFLEKFFQNRRALIYPRVVGFILQKYKMEFFRQFSCVGARVESGHLIMVQFREIIGERGNFPRFVEFYLPNAREGKIFI